MSKRMADCVTRPAGRLLVAVAVLAVAATACHKKTPVVQQAPAASVENTEPLAGEVSPLLTSQLHAFIQQEGRAPTNFFELRARLDLVPGAPPGKSWAIDYATKEVKMVSRPQ